MRLADPIDLAAGMDRYIAIMRGQQVPGDREAMRLRADLAAGALRWAGAPPMAVCDSFVVAPDREIPVRLYRPEGGGARPALCYFHGGGFAFGSIESFDTAARALCAKTGAIVVSVGYRRLPEADYAAAQADCDHVFAWLSRQAETLGASARNLAVAGDSAGALLATACAAAARGDGAAPVCQLLFYGTYAMAAGRAAHRESRDPLLTAARIGGYIDLFRGCGGTARRPAPVDRDDLAAMPPAFIVSAEHDPLADEAADYARRLRDAGVPVFERTCPGMIHGFLRAIGVSPAVGDELDAVAAAVRPILWRGLEREGER